MNKIEAKNKALNLYHQGYTVYYVAKAIGKSNTTVYRYLQEEYDEIRYPTLKNQIKEVLLQGDFQIFVENLKYKDVCLLRRKFSLYGYDKASKIKAIVKYLKEFSILGLYPENVNRNSIKKAYFNKVKQVHPDLNKELDKSGKEFQEVHQSYNYLMARA